MKVPFETMNAFVKKVRLEVLFPSYKNPGAETLLHGDLIALEDEKVVCQTQTIDTLRAADTRFTFGKPVLILHWGTDSPWAVNRAGQLLDTIWRLSI